jgi:hypothetical protein
MRYAVQAGIPIDFVENTLFVDADGAIHEFKDLVDKLSKFTHITEKAFGLDADEVNDLVRKR